MGLPTDHERPPYLLAADALRAEITTGRLKPGDKLPSARELEERFGIANMTVRSAIRVLRDEGLVYSVQGRGSYVRRSQPGGDPTPATATEQSEQALHSEEYLDLARQIGDLKQQIQTLAGAVEKLRPADAPRTPKRR